MKKLLVLIALLAAFSLTNAQTTTWKIDPAHSNIAFSVDYMVLTEVTGSFSNFDGTLQQDENDFTKSAITVSIQTSSINTDNEKRDAHLTSADFFNVEKYPTATFASKSFEKTGNAVYSVVGDLTLHGVTKPIVINVTYVGQAKDPWGNSRLGFRGTTSIDRTEFGITYNSALETGGLLISKNVDITLNVQFIKQQSSGTN